MISPPKTARYIITCDACQLEQPFTGDLILPDPEASIPPAGWAEIAGFAEPRDGNPPRRMLLNRHLCPACEPKVGPFLRNCGLDVTVHKAAP